MTTNARRAGPVPHLRGRVWHLEDEMGPDIKIDEKSKRRICHDADRWSPEKSKEHSRWIHPDAVDIGTCSEGCCNRYDCPGCGNRWTEGSD